MPLQGSGLTFAHGAMAGQQQNLEQEVARRELENKNRKLTIEEGELGFKAADLQNKQHEFYAKQIQEGLQGSIARMTAFASTVKELGPKFKAGSALDKAIDTEKNILARFAKLNGLDENLGMAAAENVRAQAMIPKQNTLSPGQQIVEQGEGGPTVVAQAPYAPGEFEKKVQAYERMVGRKATQEELNAMSGAQPGDSNSRYTPTGPYVDADGNIVGEGSFDRRTGTTSLNVPGQTSGQPIPAGARPATESSLSRNAMTGDQFLKLADEVRDTESSIRAVSRYFKNVNDSEQGWKLLANQFIGQLKTIFGKDVNQQEFTTLLQTGQLQGLLGRFRKEVVGGGVMTEQDALRVMSALGGDVSALRNPDVVAELLRNIVKDKLSDYEERLRPVYNEQLRNTPRGKGLKPKEAHDLDADKVFSTKKKTEGGGSGNRIRFDAEGNIIQ